MLIEMFTVRAHLVFEVVNVTEPIQIWLTGLRTTADKLYSSITINRSKMNSSILYYSVGRVEFTLAKSVHLNIKLVRVQFSLGGVD